MRGVRLTRCLCLRKQLPFLLHLGIYVFRQVFSGISIYVLCVHGPDVGSGADVVVEFWDNLFKLCKQYKTTLSRTIIAGDFNHGFGSAISKAICNLFPTRQLKAAASIHKHVIDNRHLIPSTFTQYHPNPPFHTFTHACGSKHRIDFTTLPDSSRSLKSILVSLTYNILIRL